MKLLYTFISDLGNPALKIYGFQLRSSSTKHLQVCIRIHDIKCYMYNIFKKVADNQMNGADVNRIYNHYSFHWKICMEYILRAVYEFWYDVQYNIVRMFIIFLVFM